MSTLYPMKNNVQLSMKGKLCDMFVYLSLSLACWSSRSTLTLSFSIRPATKSDQNLWKINNVVEMLLFTSFHSIFCTEQKSSCASTQTHTLAHTHWYEHKRRLKTAMAQITQLIGKYNINSLHCLTFWNAKLIGFMLRWEYYLPFMDGVVNRGGGQR